MTARGAGDHATDALGVVPDRLGSLGERMQHLGRPLAGSGAGEQRGQALDGSLDAPHELAEKGGAELTHHQQRGEQREDPEQYQPRDEFARSQTAGAPEDDKADRHDDRESREVRHLRKQHRRGRPACGHTAATGVVDDEHRAGGPSGGHDGVHEDCAEHHRDELPCPGLDAHGAKRLGVRQSGHQMPPDLQDNRHQKQQERPVSHGVRQGDDLRSTGREQHECRDADEPKDRFSHEAPRLLESLLVNDNRSQRRATATWRSRTAGLCPARAHRTMLAHALRALDIEEVRSVRYGAAPVRT